MASPKPKRKPKAKNDAEKKSQSERFKETARMIGADKSGVIFERAFAAITPPKRSPKRNSKTKNPAE